VDEDAPLPETAYYYPEPYWQAEEGSWIKSLLLFFDDVAIVMPGYMHGRHTLADPSLVEPLEDSKLLRILEPEWFVDERLTTQLTNAVETLVIEGVFDSAQPGPASAELSMSTRAFTIAHELAHVVYKELEGRDLARAIAAKDHVSIRMHPRIRSIYLALIAQLAREAGKRRGLDLHPATNNPGATASLQSLLALEPKPSRGNLVSLDRHVVSIDLDAVPLDEVLDFRAEHRDAHRRYVRNLRSFLVELSQLDEGDRERALADRQAEIEEAARDLHRRARRAWKSPKEVAGFGLGIAGVASSLIAHNPVAAALTAIGAGIRMLPGKAEGDTYSYLFAAGRNFSS
jgi:hypothetical protein